MQRGLQTERDCLEDVDNWLHSRKCAQCTQRDCELHWNTLHQLVSLRSFPLYCTVLHCNTSLRCKTCQLHFTMQCLHIMYRWRVSRKSCFLSWSPQTSPQPYPAVLYHYSSEAVQSRRGSERVETEKNALNAD